MNTKVAVVLLLLGSAADAQWGGVSGQLSSTKILPRVLTPPYFNCPDTTLLPLTTTPIATDTTSRVSVSVEAWCGGNPLGGLAESDCGSKEWWHVADDRDEISTLESELTVEIAPGSVQTLLLIDLSNSVQQVTPLEKIKEGVIRYINYAYDRLGQTGPHRMSIYTFDERETPQLTLTWTNDRQALINAIGKIVCGQETFPGSGITYCSHSSTNLYGTLKFGAEEIERQYTPTNVQNIRMTSRGHDSAILIFTDGEDLADRVSHISARAELTRVGCILFAVGVRADPNSQFGPQQQLDAMQKITLDTNAAFIAPDFDSVPATYDLASAKLIAYFSRSYKLTFCSPRRAMSHTLEVRVRKQGTTALGPRSEFIRGQTVRYVQNTNNGVAGLMRNDGLVTEVLNADNTYNHIRYRVSFPNVNVNDVIAFPDELDMIYNTIGFGPSYTCLSNTARTQECSIPSGALAPYTCTGGGLYNCASKRCDCAIGSCGGNTNNMCFNRVQSTTPPLYVNRECPNGLPQGPLPVTSFTRSTDSTLSMVFTAQCADGSPIGGLTFSPCADLSSVTVLESRDNSFDKISLFESKPRITCVPKPAHVTSLLLLDMSDSILRGYGGLQRLKDYAVAYVQGITEDLTSHVVSVYTFDGQHGLKVLTTFGSASTAISAIRNLNCGSHRCVDPSSNLNGAIVEGNIIMNQYQAANPTAADGTGRQPFLVLFSDGADQAQRYSDAAAMASATNGTGIFAIGIQGEPRADTVQRGVDIQRLTNIARSSVYVVGTAAELQAAFKQVGNGISSAAASSYRLDYCSPKRSGIHRVRIQLTHFNSVTYWEQEFDAGSFDCSGQRCNKCLAESEREFSCAIQPGPSHQNFICGTNSDQPLTRDGYCRCPCSDAALYPPATQAGPGPIICEKQGTCSSGEPVSCSNHGGMNSSVQMFNRFGASLNSRVSMEFTPSCADGWPIPALKMSVCDLLSDFRIYETDSTGASVPISKFESEPRISCYPDVVSLILLDTSGSITSGNTEAALKAAVINYLQTMEQNLQVTHTIGIYAFDGRSGVHEIQAFTSNYQTSIAKMEAWSCALGNFCGVDPSTNLYGAMIIAEGMLRNTAGSFNWRQRPYLVVFTDGTDQAARSTEAEAISALSQAAADYELKVYGVGIEGERQNGMMGLDSIALSRLAPAGAFLAADSSGVTVEFTKVANEIISLTQDSDTTSYRLDYCSPKRSGLTTVTVEVLHDNMVSSYSTQFDASQFQCSGNDDLCGTCLSKRVYSCVNQPQGGVGGGEQQFFLCEDGKAPTDVNGMCKCPCVGTYPPDPTPTPTNVPAPVNQVATPTFSPSSGTYTNSISVTITSETGATIYYTTDGSVPTSSSIRYTGPFSWSNLGTTTLRAIAMVNLRPNSIMGAATYTISNVAPPATPVPTSGGCSRFSLTGFSMSAINTRYTLDNSRMTNSIPTFWSDNGQYFIYKCSSTSYYYITVSTDFSSTMAFCLGNARSLTLASGAWEQALSGSFVSVAISYVCINTPPTPPTPTPPTPPTPFTPIPTNIGAPPGIVSKTIITVPAGRLRSTYTENSVITGMSSGTSGHCSVPQSATHLFSGTIIVEVTGSVGNFVFTPMAAGTTQVTCALWRNGITAQLQPITLTIQADSTGTLFSGMRIALRQTTASFNPTTFISAIRSLVGVNTDVVLRWVCPETHCWGKTVCTGDISVCRVSFTEREAATLQSEDVVYVDFDLSGYTDKQLQSAVTTINNDVSKCWDDDVTCRLRDQNVDRKAVLVTSDQRADFGDSRYADSDDDLETWEWVLIIAGCVLFCILLIVIIACLMRGKKADKTKEQQFDDPKKSEEMRPHSTAHAQSPVPRGKEDGDMAETSYYEDSYSSPSGSQSQSYYSTSYAPEKFEIDEQVKALYVDGQWYDAKVWSHAEDGTYEVQWYDGQHSDGIPADQIKRA